MIHWACTLGSSCSQILQLFQQLVVVSALSPGSFSFDHLCLTTLPQFCDSVTCGSGTAARDRTQNSIVGYRNELNPHRVQCSSFCAGKMPTFSFLETCLFRKALMRTTSSSGTSTAGPPTPPIFLCALRALLHTLPHLASLLLFLPCCCSWRPAYVALRRLHN